ncbi:MAG: TfoX/Sxy family protein [Rhodobacteraceae bacterium]|nr:TfoX/Sxy family protein [Paracoccaceae bacterium]
MAKVSTIPNLGPASEEAFARAGIHSAEEIRALGADGAYFRLLQAGARPHFIGYYVLVMGLQGRPWNDCKGAEKAALRKAFDEICARSLSEPSKEKDRLRLEAVLDEIGLVARARP